MDFGINRTWVDSVRHYQSIIVIKMDKADSLSLLSHLINFSILIYFLIFLLKINALDMLSLSINFFGLLISLIANIMSVKERVNKNDVK